MPSLQILLVEDNATDVLLVEIALQEMANFTPRLTVASRMAEAETLLSSQSFDVVLLDLSLPDGEGLPNFEQVNAVAPQIPVIVLTGRADEALALQSIQSGASDYLIKGHTDAPLLERSVRYAIERKKHENARMELVSARIARAEAESANRAKDEFLATLSHELRTPLNAILGWASLMRTGQLGVSEQKQALETIERNARVQAQLIEDLLDVSRVVTGNLRLSLVSEDIGPIVEAAIRTVSPLAVKRMVTIHAQVDPHLVVACDFTRMQQILWNLISNAIKFSEVQAQIWVEATRATDPEMGAVALITVKDEGHGIPADVLPHLFERFFQEDASSTRRHGGLGLGLSIVRHLVELHGGRVNAQSGGAGMGSTFTVMLPTAQG